MPVLVWSGLSTTLSYCGTQSAAPVIGLLTLFRLLDLARDRWTPRALVAHAQA